MSTYYWTCPKCGANLDPGEQCDCREDPPPTMEELGEAAAAEQWDK